MEIRILIPSPFNYIYGSKERYYSCGESFYLNLNDELALKEFDYILNSSPKKQGWLHIEEKAIALYQELKNIPVVEEVVELPIAVEVETPVTEEVAIDLRAERFAQLDAMNWRTLKKLAESLNLSYTDKDQTIESILTLEFN